MPETGPWSQAENQLGLADRAHLMALARVEMDQAWRGQCPLAGARADEQLATNHEHQRVLMHLVLLQGLALGQQQRDDAAGLIVGTKDLRLVRRDTQTI